MSLSAGALLLDLDGVLFDSEPLHRRAWEACLAELGASPPAGWYDDQRGRSALEVAAALGEIVSRAVPHPPPAPSRSRGEARSGPRPAALAARKRLLFRALVAGVPPSPGVVEALAELRLPAVVVSSSPAEDVQALLGGSPLEPLLQGVVAGEDVASPKPSPEGYLLAMRRLGTSPGRCVAVEDSGPGIRAALAAGLRVVAVAAGGQPPPGAALWRPTSAEAIRLAAALLAQGPTAGP